MDERTQAQQAQNIFTGVNMFPTAEETSAAMGTFYDVQQAVKEQNADILTLQYPRWKDAIIQLRNEGAPEDLIREVANRKEAQALLYAPKERVDAYFQRTPEGMNLAARAERRRMTDTYAQASGLTREDVEERMTIAEALSVPAYRLISDDELTNMLRPQFKLRESLLESGVNGFFESEMASRKSAIGRDLMYGLRGYTPELQKEIEGIDQALQQFAPALQDTFWNKGARGVGQFFDLMRRTATKGTGYGLTAAALAAAAGVTVAPWSILAIAGTGLTAAGAFGAGYAFGSALEMAENEGGEAMLEYLAMKDKDGKPMDFRAAQVAALTVGLANAVIEEAQMGQILEPLKGKLNKETVKALLNNPGILEKFIQLGKDYVGNVTSETAEEIVQKAVTIIGGEAAKLMSGRNFEHISMEDALKELAQEGKESLPTMTLLALPGAAANGVRDVAETRQEWKTQAAIKEAQAKWDAMSPEEKAAKYHEIQETIVREAQKNPMFHSEEAANIRDGLKRQFMEDGGMSEELAGANADLLTAFAINMKERNPDVDLSLGDFANVVVKSVTESMRETGEERGETYHSPVNPGVDMDTVFDVEPIDITGIIPDRQTLLQKLKDLAAEDAMITRDELAAIGVGGRKKRDHVAYSSKNVGARDAGVQEVRGNAVSSIDTLISQSVLVESAPNTKLDKKPDVAAYHRFYVPIVAKNEDGSYTLYKVRIVAEEAKGTKNIRPLDVTLYDVIVEDDKGSPSPSDSASDETRPVVDTGEPSFKVSLREMLRNVNDMDGNSYLDANDNPVPPNAWQKQRYQDWLKNNANNDTYGQRAWTGSRNEFDAFDPDMVGTGVGTQWQGWGFYFASRRAIANWYRAIALGGKSGKIDANKGAVINGEKIENIDLSKIFPKNSPEYNAYLSRKLAEFSEAFKVRVKDHIAQEKRRWGGTPSWVDAQSMLDDFIDDAIRVTGLYDDEEISAYLHENVNFAMYGEDKKGGQLTQAEIPDSDVLLDWNRKLSEQPEKVKTALQGVAKEFGVSFNENWTGEELYKKIAVSMGGDLDSFNTRSNKNDRNKEVSLLLDKYGIKGIQYLDEISQTHREDHDSHNFVIFDEKAIQIWETYRQSLEQTTETVNGSISWAGGAAWQTPSLIEFFKTANASTGFHEMGHHILRVMVDVSKLDGASAQLKDDINTILDHAGVTMEEFETDRDKRTQAHEYFARSWETYLSEGKAPTPELQGAFDRIRQWMIEVYHDVVQALGIELSDEMRDVFDRILATPDQLAEQRQIGNIALEEMARAEEMKKTAGEIEELEAQIAAEPEEEADQAPMPEDEEQKALDEVGAWFDEQARLKEQGESDYPADWGEVEPDSRGEAYDQIIGPQGAERLDAEDAGNRIDNLGMARQMEEAGKDKKTIRLATGWERGTDGKWKFEILDGELRQENVKEDSITTLGEIYDAPELYAAYPELKDRKVVISNLTGTHFGGYVNSEGTIWLNPEAKSIKSEVVHEVQHVVQEIEGFMRGGFVGEAYRKVGGEVEARNAQTRLDMTAEERRNTLLTETEDVAPEDQVILRDAVEVAENIRRGTEAMEKVITEQTDVMNAMRRDDVGDISFFWGEPGRGEKFKHGWGISHLLAHRDAQHQKDPQRYPDGMSVLRKMPEVIAKGEIVRDVGEDIPNAQRVNIAYDGYTAILSLYKDGNRQTWLLTGWKDDEKSSDASGEVYGPTGATLDGPTRFRPEEGAEVSGTSLPETGEAVNEAQMAGNAADSEADKHAEKAALQAEGSDSVTDSATDSAAEIDAYNAAMEEYEVKKTAREYVETITKLIRQNGGLRLEDFIHDVGEEAAKELRKKWPGLFRNTQQGPQLQLDVLTQQLQANGIDLDVRGLVDWLTDTLNEKPEKPVPPALTAKTLKAVVEKYGGEAASQYLAERKKYLEKLIRKEENPEQFKLLTKELRAVDRLIAGEKAARKIGKLKEHYRDWITRLKAEHKAKLAAQKEKYKGRSADAEIRRRLELGSQKATLERKANARLQQMRERLRQLKDRYAAMEAQRKERRKLGQEIDKTVKDINRMANSKTIRYGRQEEIQALLKDYDLKRRGKKTMNRRAEVTTLLYINGMLDNQGVRPMSEEEMTFLGLTPKDLKYIGATALNDMTLGDLKALQNQVGAVFELGKAEFDAWKTDQQERRAAARGALKESLDKKHGPAPKVVAGAEDLGKQYTGILGTLEKAKDWVYSTWMTSDRFFDWLDGGHTKYNGAFVKYFADGLNAATDEAKEHVQERVKWIQDELRKLGFKMSDFSKKAADAAGRSWTWNEVMELYLGMRNEKKAKAIIYGNFVNGNGQGPVMSAEQAQATIQQLISVLTPEHRAAAELVIQDHEANFDRLNRRYIDSINRGMRQEVDYTSIHRLEHQTQHGLIDMNDEAALENGMSDAAIMKRVETGFMLERQAIADENQSPVMLGLFSNWMNDISRHEQAAAMLQIGTDLTSALMSKGEEGRPLIKQLSDKFGDNARRALVSFFNDSVTDGQRLAFDFLGDLSNGVARNMSIAYIAGNCGTVLKQTTSIPRFLITAGAHRLIWATARFLTNPTAFLERAYALDPQLRDRGGDTLISAVLRSPEWGKAAYQRGLEWMFTPVSAMDRWVAAIGWTATYEANLAKGATQEHAIREAQRAVRLTQQAASAKDLPRMWRNGGVMKLMMMFTSDTAATLGMTAYDFAQQVSSGEWNTTMKAFSTVLALAVTAAAMKAARDGVGGDDDDEDGGLGSWMGSALTEEFISSLPLIGKEAMMFYEELSGKWHGTTYSAFMTPIVKLFKGIGLLTDEDEDEDAFWRASGMFLDAAALSGVAPVPATAIRRVVRSAVMMGEDDAGNAVRNLLGMRVRQEE